VVSRSAFAITFDYRCPFARNLNEHVLTGLAAGAGWAVDFVPFSLGQLHAEDAEVGPWQAPEKDTGLLALQVGVVVRDHYPARFGQVHRALFALRHDRALPLADRAELERLVEELGLPVDDVFAPIESGAALDVVRAEHEKVAASHAVWGVPTLLMGESAVFIRVMDRSDLGAEPQHAIAVVERALGLLAGWPELNEYKHTTIPR
jgi:2-hydroxychromene-2-carboxylate isomerase